MIRINLLAEPEPTLSTATRDHASKTALAAIVILLAVSSGMAWRYRAIALAELDLSARIEAARSEARRTSDALKETAALETTRGELQQRAANFQMLRERQSAPVHLLDRVSRSLPDSAWLTRLEQDGGAVTIDGQCASMTALADFVSNLESVGLFQRPISIVTSESVVDPTSDSDLVRFSIKATFPLGDRGAR